MITRTDRDDATHFPAIGCFDPHCVRAEHYPPPAPGRHTTDAILDRGASFITVEHLNFRVQLEAVAWPIAGEAP